MASKAVVQTRRDLRETVVGLRKHAPGGFPRLLVAGLLVYMALFAVWQLVLSGQIAWSETVDSLTTILPDLGVIALLIIVLRKATLDRASRRAWFFILLASSATFLGNAIWAVYELALGQEPFPSWADAAYLVFYPLMMLGLLSFPVARRKPADRATLWLDTGIVLIASWMAIWYFVLGPTIEFREPGLLTTVLSVAYPLGDLLLLYAVARILIRGAGIHMTPAISLIVPSVVVLVVGDLGFSYLSLNETYYTGHVIDLAWVLSPALIALAGYVQLAQRAPDPAIADVEESVSSLIGSLLPYGAMVVGYALLLAGSLQGNTIRMDGLVLGTIALSALVIGRQVLAFNDNHRLLNQSYALSQRMRESEARFRSLVQHGSDIILLLDSEYHIRYISPSILRITGVQPEALADQPLLDRLHPDDRPAAQIFLESSIKKPGFIGRLEVRVRHAEGSWLHVEAICSNQLQNPNVEGIVINARDITDRKMLEARLVSQANHDSLTGLANRKYFVEHLELALHQDVNSAEQLAVLFLDLDLFKEVNDSLGHSYGDDLLVQVAARLSEWAGPRMLPARLGGDEFTLLVESVQHQDEIQTLAGELQHELDRPYIVGGHVVDVSPSIGIALGQPGRDEADDILRRADSAMYQEKAGRRVLRKL